MPSVAADGNWALASTLLGKARAIRAGRTSYLSLGVDPEARVSEIGAMHRSAFVWALVGFGSIAGSARAAGTEADWDGGYKQLASRRSGFTAGLSLGLAFGSADGYPNELAKLSDVNYERNTKFAFGAGEKLWLGGALTDWFVFGAGFTSVRIKHEVADARGSAFIFHVEGYPLFYRGGAFRDLSLFADFGAGSMKISGGDREQASGGLMSVIGVGAGYAPLRFWRFTFGPTVEYLRLFSESMSVHTGLVQARLTFVGGP